MSAGHAPSELPWENFSSPLPAPGARGISLTKKNFFFFFANFFRLFLAVLSLHCCVGFCLVAAREDYSLVVVHGLHIAMAALVAGHRL